MAFILLTHALSGNSFIVGNPSSCGDGYTHVTDRNLCCDAAKNSLNLTYYSGGWSCSFPDGNGVDNVPHGCLTYYGSTHLIFNEHPSTTVDSNSNYNKICAQDVAD